MQMDAGGESERRYERARRLLPPDLERIGAERREDLLAALKGIHTKPSPVLTRAEDDTSRDGEDAGSPGGGFTLPAKAPRLLGVCGAPRSGKDYLADYLIDRYTGVRKLVYSDLIISEVNDYLLTRWGRGYLIGEENKSEPENRHLLQAWALARRAEDALYWSQPMADLVRESMAAGLPLVIVSGVRVPSDWQLLAGLGGELWRVDRRGNSYRADHPVESRLGELQVERVVDNPAEGDLSPFEENIEAALRGRG